MNVLLVDTPKLTIALISVKITAFGEFGLFSLFPRKPRKAPRIQKITPFLRIRPRIGHFLVWFARAAKRGCFKRGGFPIWTCPSFFVLFCPFGTFPGIFPICSGMVRGFSRFVLFLFLGLLRAPTRNSPERVRDTIWTCPEKSGKHPGLETPRFSFSQGLLGVTFHSIKGMRCPKPLSL